MNEVFYFIQMYTHLKTYIKTEKNILTIAQLLCDLSIGL